ncbi:hypothetical protein [Methylobacterium sp. 17Sr1-1]|uniref:hypothetical protein n=1 Tax=Methylobacterium sp. 17Sr1-1 TaxID=2202826 RepID=UPI000D6F57D0|nr:hypothetical protein [Methylobacterium sp. 17Sr1-1]AWN51803.1 hypothetical protein DK412_08995 [Methylobacterium sp. 17Sr1-1]
MASNPPAGPAGQLRVVRIAHHVTEAYVTASTPAQAVALAKALKPSDWYTRPVLQPAGEDVFEYNVVSSDGL